MPKDSIGLSQLPRELKDAAGEGAIVPSYRAIYNAVLDGRVPDAEQVNGRWFIPRAALPRVAAALGVALPRATRSRRPQAAPSSAAVAA